MVRYRIEKANANHIQPIVDNLRGVDHRFIYKYLNDSVEGTLSDRINNSEFKYTLFIDDKPAMIAGVTRPIMITNTGYSWLLATPKVNTHRIAVARITKKYIKSFKENYAKIVALVDPDDKVSVRWHEWIGFKLKLVNRNGLEYFEARLED